MNRLAMAAALAAVAWAAVRPVSIEREGDKPRPRASGSLDARRDTFRRVDDEQVRAVRRGLDFLVRVQDPHKGFFRPQIEDQDGRVAVTALCCLSFLANGSTPGRGPYGDPLARGIRYLLRASNTESDQSLRGYISTPGDGLSRMHGHGYATLVLAEAYGMSGAKAEQGVDSPEALRARLVDAVRLIERSQSSEGGWGYLPDRTAEHEGSITVCELQALRSASHAGIAVNPLTIRRATEYLHRSQEPDGSFVYSLYERRASFELTAAAVSTLHARGIYDSPEVRRGLDYLLRRSFDDLFFAELSYFYYGSFYAAQALYHSSDPRDFDVFFDAVRARLLRIQAADGSWSDATGIEKYGSTYATAMATLVLQIPYEFLPIFQR